MTRMLDLRDYPMQDARERFAAALADAKKEPGATLFVPPGEYVLTSPLARKTMEDVIAGRHGENPEDDMFSPDFAFTVGLSFAGHRGTTLSAYGATLLIDGFMEPIALDRCEGVRLLGLTIDHRRKPFSRGTIEEYRIMNPSERTGEIVVRFDPRFPVDEHTIMPRYCAYDYHTHRFNLDMKVLSRRFLGRQCFLFEVARMPEADLRGQEFYVWHSFHFRPGILIENSRDVTLTDVTIHSQPGMGIVGHRSENILLERLRVIPAHGEHMSTNTDATHFTSCRGNLVFRECQFDGHGDDATNVHTFYHDIERLGPDCFRGSVAVKTHSLTADYPDEGDTLELVDKQSLLPLRSYRVLSVEADLPALRYVARLDGALPEDAAERCFFCNVSQLPRLQLLNCTANNHWARSVLIKTRHALVEGCTFTGSVLQAIHVAAEGWWREGAACEDVIIRGNRFVDCGLTGHAPVGGVKVEMSTDSPEGTPQRHIVIEDNLFDLPGVQRAVHVSHADDVRIRGNIFLHCADPVEILDSTRVAAD